MGEDSASGVPWGEGLGKGDLGRRRSTAEELFQKDLDAELGFTFSVGLAPNKVVAKIASKWQKPSGLTAIPGRELHRYLAKLPVEKYGKHTVFLGASFLAHTHAQHNGDRGHLPERQHDLLPGETARRRLAIPMFMGEVS